MYYIAPGQPPAKIEPGSQVTDAIDKLTAIILGKRDIANKEALTEETRRSNMAQEDLARLNYDNLLYNRAAVYAQNKAGQSRFSRLEDYRDVYESLRDNVIIVAMTDSIPVLSGNLQNVEEERERTANRIKSGFVSKYGEEVGNTMFSRIAEIAYSDGMNAAQSIINNPGRSDFYYGRVTPEIRAMLNGYTTNQSRVFDEIDLPVFNSTIQQFTDEYLQGLKDYRNNWGRE